ncbi:hypothetical protein BKA66DRAFT_474125 [Pyrenochaeta sp. MPI-SDFR-AT-0127]|nr:hypothetical protein BKA66DRAFT_474125 [Pyrenochaeta sp. MPI-SDFR-AT-0127]
MEVRTEPITVPSRGSSSSGPEQIATTSTPGQPTSSAVTRSDQIAANRAAMQVSAAGIITISQQQVRQDHKTVNFASMGLATGAALAAYVRLELSIPRSLHFRRRRSFNGYTDHSSFDMFFEP